MELYLLALLALVYLIGKPFYDSWKERRQGQRERVTRERIYPSGAWNYTQIHRTEHAIEREMAYIFGAHVDAFEREMEKKK